MKLKPLTAAVAILSLTGCVQQAPTMPSHLTCTRVDTLPDVGGGSTNISNMTCVLMEYQPQNRRWVMVETFHGRKGYIGQKQQFIRTEY